jgi:tRNA dimethylallyltransferase
MPPLVVIVGETASGKSALALELAQKFNGELICADSWTVYKGFDIGTAKPSTADQKLVPHHLLDVANAQTGFNAVMFQQLAFAAIDDIQARGKLPILVGGTGLYIDSILYHYEFLPPTAVELRDELNKLSLGELLVRAENQGLSTQGIDVGNKRRVVRLIENEGRMPSRKPMRENTLVLGVSMPRESLHERIEGRVDSMLTAHLEAEARQLAEEYGWDTEPMKGIGYWQWKDYFAGTKTLEETRARIIKASMDLAKRQRTWFKRNESIQWLGTEDKSAQAVDLVTTFLNKTTV